MATASSTVDLVRVLEATYALELSDAAWLRGVVESLRPAIQDGLGMAAYVYDASVRPLAVRELFLDCPIDAAGLASVLGSSDESYVRGSWLSQVATTASQTPGYDTHPGVRDVFHPAGIHDVLVINALDPLGIGCLVGAPLKTLRTLSDGDRERWQRVGAHIQTALRLKLRLSGAAAPASEDDAGSGKMEAVLAPSGKVEHLEPRAHGADIILKEAVLAMDRARRSYRRRPDHTLDAWRTLVRARWTLVHEFESDGKHFVVARANAASESGPKTLSSRERQVLGCLALGHSQKVIAYELGLSHSTVRVLLARARAKLGATDLGDLIAKFRVSGGS